MKGKGVIAGAAATVGLGVDGQLDSLKDTAMTLLGKLLPDLGPYIGEGTSAYELAGTLAGLGIGATFMVAGGLMASAAYPQLADAVESATGTLKSWAAVQGWLDVSEIAEHDRAVMTTQCRAIALEVARLLKIGKVSFARAEIGALHVVIGSRKAIETAVAKLMDAEPSVDVWCCLPPSANKDDGAPDLMHVGPAGRRHAIWLSETGLPIVAVEYNSEGMPCRKVDLWNKEVSEGAELSCCPAWQEVTDLFGAASRVIAIKAEKARQAMRETIDKETHELIEHDGYLFARCRKSRRLQNQFSGSLVVTPDGRFC